MILDIVECSQPDRGYLRQGLETGASSVVMSEFFSEGSSLASLSRHTVSHSFACSKLLGRSIASDYRIYQVFEFRAISLSGGTASTR